MTDDGFCEEETESVVKELGEHRERRRMRSRPQVEHLHFWKGVYRHRQAGRRPGPARSWGVPLILSIFMFF